MNRIIPLIILLVVGCATPKTEYQHIYKIRFIHDTTPQGASFICNGQDAGYTPNVSLWNNIDLLGENRAFTEEEITKITQGNEYDVYPKDVYERSDSVPCSAHWSSGVTKEYPVDIPYTYVGNGVFIYTLQRPKGAGYAQDAEFALKVQQLKQAQQTANQNASIAISAVQAQQRAAAAQERAAAAQAFQNTKSTTCYTNLGITTCY